MFTSFSTLFGKAKKNTFYISRIETDDNKVFWLYVYWKEDNSILTLCPPFDKENESYLPAVYGRCRELGKNIVQTEEIENFRKLITRRIANGID